MAHNQWENQLRDLLGEYKAPESTSPLGTDPAALNSNPEATPTPDQLQAWKRIEASLDAADQAFDETVRQKVNHFNPPYDPHSWPIFLNRLADTRYLRAKLIVLKSVEVAILLLLILSAVNIERTGKFPFQSNQNSQIPEQQRNEEKNNTATQPPFQIIPAPSPKPGNNFAQADPHSHPGIKDHSRLLAEKSEINNLSRISSSFSTDRRDAAMQSAPAEDSNSFSSAEAFMAENQVSSRSSLTESTHEIPSVTMNGLQFLSTPDKVPVILPLSDAYITEPIASADLLVGCGNASGVPEPKFIEPLNHTYTEFSMLAQVDYNALKMPEDRLYSAGKEIIFPSKGIMSPGFGAGFTIAVGHPIWALETGVIYSAKDFEPGRQLIVGGAFDNGSVEFEAMKLQMVSLPMQYRYRFDHQGRFKTYALAGGSFNVIAQSNIDVSIKYNFPSLSFGENPNNDPYFAQTIQESRRIREHIRDGAPFSTKNFVSVNAGLGFEYMLMEHKAIFVQAVAQYQIPNVAFSNNNGKHLRSVSLQAGIRGPLGK